MLALINYDKTHSLHFLKLFFHLLNGYLALLRNTQTNPLLFPKLNFSYNSEGEMTSFELINFGTSPVATTANSLIAGNQPN